MIRGSHGEFAEDPNSLRYDVSALQRVVADVWNTFETSESTCPTTEHGIPEG